MGGIRVLQSRGLVGEVTVPGDKSITHRAIIVGGVARGRTRIRGYLPSADCLATLRALERCGLSAERKGDLLEVQGKGLWGLQEPDGVLDLGNSGTGLRLLTGLLSGQRFFSVLTGDSSLRSRPMRRIVDPLRQMGAWICGRSDGDRAPLAIRGTELVPIRYESPVPSAQVKSALLLAGLYASGRTTVVEPFTSRDHTERLLRLFGVPVEEKGCEVSVEGHPEIMGQEIDIPGDLSSAAFFLVAGSCIEGSEIIIRGVGINPTRTGVLDVLMKMGADLIIEQRRDLSGEPVADITVRSRPLVGTTISGDLIPRTIDELLVLSVAGVVASGETVIRDARELRVKETDRVAAMATELQKMGADVTPLPDGLVIRGGHLRGMTVRSWGDHRVAMSLVIAGLIAEGETIVEDTECIDTSFPGFFELVGKLTRGKRREA